MAGFFEQILGTSPKNFAKDAVKGFFGVDYLRDYQHASKTFRSDAYAYSPKYKFLFHVYFDINTDLIGAKNAFPTDNHFGLAVKTVQLPSYSFDTHVMNQYNRKRIVQTKVKYDPINITFHDDNANLIRKLWYNYYSYHYVDPTKYGNGGTQMTPQQAAALKSQKFQYKRNIYSDVVDGGADWGYAGESSLDQQSNLATALGSTKAPYFNSINIYGFNQHNFVMYQLVNPVVTSFKHDTYDYSATSAGMEHTMTVDYETVKYWEGAVDGNAILTGKNQLNVTDDFGTPEHYDPTVSPIGRPGSNASILGPGGLMDAGGGILDDLTSIPPNILGAVQKAGTAFNTVKSAGGLGALVKGDMKSMVGPAIVSGASSARSMFFTPTPGSK